MDTVVKVMLKGNDASSRISKQCVLRILIVLELLVKGLKITHFADSLFPAVE
jgi:hypothetical protein